jgi:prolyl oligopeptidase PreP (S9A serine peptidase family)
METPSDKIFNEMKQAATQIWNTYDNQFGYVDEKMSRVNNIDNIQDNAMVFYRMFDMSNQTKFRGLVSVETLNYISKNL